MLTQPGQNPLGSDVSWLLLRLLRAHPHGVKRSFGAKRREGGTAWAHNVFRLTQFAQKLSGSVVSWLPPSRLRAHPHGVSEASD